MHANVWWNSIEYLYIWAIERKNQKQFCVTIPIYENMPGIRLGVINRELQRQVETSASLVRLPVMFGILPNLEDAD